MLNTFHKELLSNVAVIHGANPDSAKILRDDIGLTAENSKTYGRVEWMKEVSPNWTERTPDESGIVRIPKSETILTEENEIRSALNINGAATPPSLIIIDEISKFSGFDLDLIDKFAKKYGITVLTAGDFDLTGVVGNAKVDVKDKKDLNWDVALYRTHFIRSPKLGVSMRTDNLLKTTNLQKLQAYLQNPTDKVTFNYYLDETGLYGDKIHMFSVYEDGTTDKNIQADAIIKDVEAMIATLKPGEKIGYIYSDKSSPIYLRLFSEYQSKIDFREGGSAQGLEGQYYIVEVGPNTNLNVYLREVYTGMSRAQLGSLLIIPSDSDNGAVIDHKALTSKPIKEELKKEVIGNFANKKKRLLDSIIIDSQPVPYNKRTTEEAPILDNTIAPPTGNSKSLDNGIDPTPPPSPTPPSTPPTPPPTPEPDPIEPPVGTNITPLSREEIESRFGERSKISNFTINIDGVDIPLSLDLIPFINEKDESGTNNIININQRHIVVVNINGFHIPFYKSTGLEGKTLTIAGQWYPFFGISAKGWLNKATEEDMAKYYDSPIFAAISQKLNELLGTDPSNVIFGPLYMSDSDENLLEMPLVLFINLDMNPVENYTETTRETIESNINDAKLMAEGMVEELKKTITPIEDETTSVDPLIYEENDAPITNNDIVEDVVYREKINTTNSEQIVPESTAEVTGSLIPIEMLLHSFNTFETGVLEGPDGQIIRNGSEDRIDSVNGLIKIDNVLGIGQRTLAKYKEIIGDLRSIIYNTIDKAELCEKLQKRLGLLGIYCTFALKSSPYIDLKKRKNGEEFKEKQPSKFSKGTSERLEYNYSRDSRSQEVPSKSLVLIIGNLKNGDLLELPILTLSSPFTLLKILDKNKIRVFSEMYDRYVQLLNDGKTKHDISVELIKDFKSNPLYKELVDLFKLFNFTDRGIFYIKDKNWTVGNSLQLLGPQFITKAGYYLDVSGFNYEADMTAEDNWITLDELKKNPQVTVLSRVVISKTGRISGISTPVVKAGNPFVLVSFNKNLNTDRKIVDLFIELLKNPTARKEVKLMYVLPPKAKISDYILNLHKIITHLEGVQSIGHLFTSYKLLKILTKDSLFRARMELKHPRLLAKIDEAINKLDSLPNDSARKDELLDPKVWASEGSSAKPVKLAGLLDGALHDFVYSKNTLNLNIGLENTNEINPDDLNLVDSILKLVGIDGVFYTAKIKRTGAEKVTDHFLAVGEGYSINGLPFRIHGKIDSYTFKGRMGTFIDSALSRLRVNKAGHLYSIDEFRYRDGQSNLSVPHGRYAAHPNESIITANVSYITLRAGEAIGRMLSEVYQLGDKSDISIVLANQRIVALINSENNGLVAVTIGKELKISSPNVLLGNIYIMDSLGNNISDLTGLSNNNGVYTFELRTVNGTKTTEYVALVKGDTMELTPKLVEIQSPKTELTVTSETFTSYITVARSLIPLFPKVEIPLRRVFENALTFEEFITLMNNISFSNKRVSRLLALLLLNLTPELTALINELIEFENSRDPFKQNLDETNLVCPITITIKF